MKGNVMKPRAFVFIAASAVLFLAAAPQPSVQQWTKTPDWTPWRFLLGEWVGEGGAANRARALEVLRSRWTFKTLSWSEGTWPNTRRPRTGRPCTMMI